VQKAQVAPVEEENALPAQPGEHRSPLQNFLRDHYPEFSAHIDGRGQLVTADYVYVYTLLLHYSCVKQPSVFIHSICKKLPELVQTCIANFFGQTLEQQLTREFLRQSMNNVAVIYRQGVHCIFSGRFNQAGFLQALFQLPDSVQAREEFVK